MRTAAAARSTTWVRACALLVLLATALVIAPAIVAAQDEDVTGEGNIVVQDVDDVLSDDADVQVDSFDRIDEVKNDEVADDAVVEVETPTPPPASERQVRKKREAVPPRDREEDHVERTLREARERTAQKMQKVTEEMERLRAIRQQKNMRRRDGEL